MILYGIQLADGSYYRNDFRSWFASSAAGRVGGRLVQVDSATRQSILPPSQRPQSGLEKRIEIIESRIDAIEKVSSTRGVVL